MTTHVCTCGAVSHSSGPCLDCLRHPFRRNKVRDELGGYERGQPKKHGPSPKAPTAREVEIDEEDATE
jgi:hypothetical protein